ncbi:NAD(P)-dependent oxidoreductase [Polynucleobacter sp. AP-Kolm-20A-A1]|uniref:NAD-dependent epimerase/dehydratase family protein n=1 Tax=Polynucleobacter sp. AP-Kolm-20A-A1 TaxID=2081041 RepID=UPI001BFDC754|nr:NAD(P)-dependent oxidoreductase [Polynucleobacter sp. AP-Kolm-20A-A1]QWE20926.1 NAD(P)-dependent oxidoreductase [Polynucleobacter sp. AP-Kolm-20A-A1]
MASLLIIGGSGFFGKSFLDAYVRGKLNLWKIDSIGVLSRHAEQLKLQYPELINESIKLINSDIATCQDLPFADYVIHAAASTDAANYLMRPKEEKWNIQAGTHNYCALANKFHLNSRILYCSSGAVYGQQPMDVEYLSEEFDHGYVDEMSITKRDYAMAKRDSEKSIQALGSQGGAVSIARCFAFVGKYLPRDQHFAIGNFIEDGLKGRSIEVRSNHLVYRSYMYADDLVHWLMTICHSASTHCPIYNVGSDQAITISDLAMVVAQRFSVHINKMEISRNIVDRYIPSISKARDQLGLSLSTDIAGAIDKTIAALRFDNLNA